MRRYSTVSLVNSNGIEIELNEIKENVIYDLSGLGYELDTNYKKIGNEYVLLNKNYAQLPIKGSVYFPFRSERSPHKPQNFYTRFITLISRTPLKLKYKPHPTQQYTYYKNGEITEIVLNEKDSKKIDITFMPTGLWYKVAYVESRETTPIDRGKTYNYAYNYRYAYQSIYENTIYYAQSQEENSPIKFKASGKMVNPTWRHYVNDILVASGKVNYTIPSGYNLVLDTNTKPYALYMTNSNGEFIQNLYNFSDFSTERFIEFKKGINRLVFADDESNSIKIIAEVYENYATV